MVLPVNTVFDLPGLPPLDKTSIPNLSILICCLLFVGGKRLVAFRDPIILILASAFVISPFLTAYYNSEGLSYAQRILPPMTMYDAAAQAVENCLAIVPIIAAASLIDNEARRAYLIRSIMISVLVYSVPMIVEMRLSPQLHRWVYGYFPHSFGQQIRDGGFRPVVFLGHGLLVAIFCAMGLIASLAVWRSSQGRVRRRAAYSAAYLLILLILCRSLGALLLAVACALLLIVFRQNRVAIVSAVGCLMVLLYPAVRAANVIPLGEIAAIVDVYSTDRAGSLGVRIENEDQLLGRAALKPLVGWGSWGRNRIYSNKDGSDLSITDGTWIISYSSWGWIGYLSFFGLLCLPAIKLLGNVKIHNQGTRASLALILLVNLLDSVPNSSIRPITWMLSGALL